MFEWNGDLKNPPPLWEPFLYKGKPYLALDGRNMGVFDVQKKEVSLSMEVRVFGKNSSIGLANLLLKTGVSTVAEIAESLEEKGLRGIASMTAKMIEKVEKEEDPFNYLVNHEATTEEIKEYLMLLSGVKLIELLSL